LRRVTGFTRGRLVHGMGRFEFRVRVNRGSSSRTAPAVKVKNMSGFSSSAGAASLR
jgi:hypothetical protein